MPLVRTVTPDGPAIRARRERSGLTLVQLGRMTGRHPQTLRNLELEAKAASVVLINQVANALGAEVDEITRPAERAAS